MFESIENQIKGLTIEQTISLLKKYIEIKDRMLLNNYYKNKDYDLELANWFEINLPKLKKHIHSQLDDL